MRLERGYGDVLAFPSCGHAGSSMGEWIDKGPDTWTSGQMDGRANGQVKHDSQMDGGKDRKME